jgi:hypothetical protein
MNKFKKSIAVIGVGTAGVTSLSHCLAYLPDDWKVFSVADPNTPILGIGESSGLAIPQNLYRGAKFNIFDDAKRLDSIIKRGMKYVGWREDDFFMDIVPPSYGIHFNNFKLKDFCFERFTEIWKDKFNVIHAKVDDLINETDCVSVVTAEETYQFDYVVDCRGYPTDYSNYVMSDVIPVNHALINLKPEPGTWDWTYSIATRNGWMFGVPTLTRQGWGYLYNDKITNRDDAVDDIAERFKTPKEELTLKEFTWKNYYAKECLDGRIVKNGNRAMFLEPIEAVAGHFYDQVMRYFFDFLYGKLNQPQVNESLLQLAEDIESYICYIYHGGSTYDSEFWRITKETCSAHLDKDARFKEYVNKLKSMSQSERSTYMVLGMFGPNTWCDADRKFKYNYFTESN